MSAGFEPQQQTSGGRPVDLADVASLTDPYQL